MDYLLSFIQENERYLIPVLMFSVVIIASILAHYFSTKNRIIRAFKKSRRKTINTVRKNEYTKIIGKAQAITPPLIAPLSGRTCVYYHVIVEIKRDKKWKNIIDDVECQNFFIATNIERAIVKTFDLDNANKQIYLIKDFNKNSGFRNDPSEKLESYLKANNKTGKSLFGLNRKMRYREGIIELNEDIAVKGIAQWQTLTEPIDGYSYSKILTLTGTKKQKLLITDEPKALLRVKNL